MQFERNSISVGDTIAYIRNSDGTKIWGRVAYIYRRGIPKYNLMFQRLPNEDLAYHLHLPVKYQVMVGHPVTIGHSRVVEKK